MRICAVVTLFAVLVWAPLGRAQTIKQKPSDDLYVIALRANLEHTVISRASCAAAVEQFRTPDLSLDYGHYGFAVVVRGQFAPGNLCIGMGWNERVPTWVNGLHVGRGTYSFIPRKTMSVSRRGRGKMDRIDRDPAKASVRGTAMPGPRIVPSGHWHRALAGGSRSYCSADTDGPPRDTWTRRNFTSA
jgi:hypothetical protein